MSMVTYDLPDVLIEWAHVFAWASTVILIVYAAASLVIYMVVQDMFMGTDVGDKLETFTGIQGTRDRRGIIRVFVRMGIAMVLLAIVVTNSHLQFLNIIYRAVDKILMAFTVL